LGRREKIQTKDPFGIRPRYRPGAFAVRPFITRKKPPGEKKAGPFPAGPAAEESLPGSKPDRPESSAPAKESKASVQEESPERSFSAKVQKVKVIGNRDSKRYHLPGMKYYDKVLAYHRVEFDSEEEAIRAGYHKAGQ
jgi:hypothetical protein